ncbi:MAG: transcriptional regulator [Acidobacteria bacterium]|nr:transcriptional regulator [Acidobacteriota bacterium]
MPNTTKTSGKRIVRLNPQRYAELLVAALPVKIETDEQHERLLAFADKLIDKGEQRSPEEDAMLNLLVYLIQEYEQRVYQPEQATPLEVLTELMAARDLKQSDLWPVLNSKSVTSEIVNGKRGISKANAKALAEFFHVPVEVFL